MSKRRLALGRATAESVQAHNPGLAMCVVLADEAEGCFEPAAEGFRVLGLDELGVEREMRQRYSELELSYAVTPHAILRLLEEGYDGVIFLKQETLVLGSLSPELELLRRWPVLLTPHLLEPRRVEGAVWERNVLQAGVFNGGFLGFGRCEAAMGILRWWAERTEQLCERRVEEGLHFEQRWLDFFPSLVEGCQVLRDPGVNVGHWNLRERRIARAGAGYTADGVACRVMRFSGYDFHRPEEVSRYTPGYFVRDTGEAEGLFRRYQEALERGGIRECERWGYAYEGGER